MQAFPSHVAERFLAEGWWDGSTWESKVRDSVANDPDKVALIDPANRIDIVDGPPRSLTWRAVDDEASELAEVFLRHGIRCGDVVATQLPNIAELAIVYVALQRIGAIITPFPIEYREHELVPLATRAQAVAFVTATRIKQRANAVELLRMAEQIPSLGTVFTFGHDTPDGAVPLGSDDAERGGDLPLLREHLQSYTAHPNDVVTICWTSGTESQPKGVVRCHGDWSAVLWTVIESPQITDKDVLLCTFPMVSAGGLGGMFGPWITMGSTLVLHQPFDLDLFIQQIVEHRVTYTVSPPAVLTRLLQAPGVLDDNDLSSLRAVGSGSAPLTPFLIEGWEARGVEVINFFGSSEGLCLLGDRSNVPDAVERSTLFPNFDSERHPWRVRTAAQTTARLVDLETGEVVTEPARPGELRLKGPTVFSGYLGGTPVPFDDDGYFCSGDVFEYVNAECDLLRYVDRAKDLIIRGGNNISAAELENLLQSHPDIAEVAAVGQPDDDLGERVAIFAVPLPGRSLQLQQLVDHLFDQGVARFKHPERLEIVDSLPRNPSGKVLKRDLRDRLDSVG